MSGTVLVPFFAVDTVTNSWFLSLLQRKNCSFSNQKLTLCHLSCLDANEFDSAHELMAQSRIISRPESRDMASGVENLVFFRRLQSGLISYRVEFRRSAWARFVFEKRLLEKSVPLKLALVIFVSAKLTSFALQAIMAMFEIFRPTNEDELIMHEWKLMLIGVAASVQLIPIALQFLKSTSMNEEYLGFARLRLHSEKVQFSNLHFCISNSVKLHLLNLQS
jgi:hypothetical protein